MRGFHPTGDDLISGGTQIKGEGRALPDCRVDGNPTLVVVDDRQGRRQTQTSALILGGEIRIQNAIEILLTNTGAIIGNAAAHIVPWIERQRITQFDRRVYQGYIDPPALGHGLVGVDDQILHHLADLGRVPENSA